MTKKKTSPTNHSFQIFSLLTIGPSLCQFCRFEFRVSTLWSISKPCDSNWSHIYAFLSKVWTSFKTLSVPPVFWLLNLFPGIHFMSFRIVFLNILGITLITYRYLNPCFWGLLLHIHIFSLTDFSFLCCFPQPNQPVYHPLI